MGKKELYNTKMVRVRSIYWDLLKEEQKKTGKSLTRIISELIDDKYNNRVNKIEKEEVSEDFEERVRLLRFLRKISVEMRETAEKFSELIDIENNKLLSKIDEEIKREKVEKKNNIIRKLRGIEDLDEE